MKFFRFGAIKPQKQVQYEEPKAEMYPCSPPCKKGFYAFPAGFTDPFYLPLSRLPEEPYSLLQYLRDDNGRKMTENDLYRKEPDPEYKGWGCEIQVLTEEGKAFLKRRHLKENDLIKKLRPCYVMVYPDTDQDLEFISEDDHSRLNQPLTFLLDEDGNKIDAYDYFFSDFIKKFPDNYKGFYQGPDEEDFFEREETLQWLKKINVHPEQLCIWPVYDDMYDRYLTILKKYSVFEYNGCLWHHLGGYLKRSEILSQFADTWFYTDMHAYERALKKSMRNHYGTRENYQKKLGKTAPGRKPATYMNATFDVNGMYEVFFDEKIH